MSTPFVMFFHHNRWANLRVLDACAALPDALLDASNPGSYGSIRETLIHLARAEERYIELLAGEKPENPLRLGDFPGFDVLRQRLQQSGERFVKLAEQAQPGQTVQIDWDGKMIELPAMFLLVQVVNHATEHRTNITTIMAQHDQPTPGVDGWSFAEQVLLPQ